MIKASSTEISEPYIKYCFETGVIDCLALFGFDKLEPVEISLDAGIYEGPVTVELFADGQKVKSATLKESDNWKYTFKDLPKNTHGVAIQYTINEISVDGYKTSVNGNIITNTYTPKTTKIKIKISKK